MLAITLGDPLSVNVEILRRCLHPEILAAYAQAEIPVTLIGSQYHWQQQGGPEVESFIDIDVPDVCCQPAHQLTAEQRGLIAYRALSAVKNLQVEKKLAVLTMPIDKKAISLAGFDYPGQTEYFEALWQQQGLMLLAGPKLRVALATRHVPLARVSSVLSKELIQSKIRLLFQSLLEVYGLAQPRVAVCGLNPHCSDHGLFGSEEQDYICEAVAELQTEYGQHLVGPLSADTVFYQAYNGEFDAVLAMYHDQGLAPLKTVHFDTAVNITTGLKHLRVSPDHGPAAALYQKNTASILSTEAALQTCMQYLRLS